jgi:hypothetical protein
MITVIEKYYWYHHHNIASGGGIESQLTLCSYDGIMFWVRENINALDSFAEISSGERFGEKEGWNLRKSRQCLEVFVPAQFERRSREIIAVVSKADTLRRPVKTNKLFNQQWIKKFLAEDKKIS